MIAARLATICPGCSDRIEPGDMIGQIGLAYHCSECFGAWEVANRMAPPVRVSYPLSSTFEPEV